MKVPRMQRKVRLHPSAISDRRTGRILKSLLSRQPHFHIDGTKPGLHGYHSRGTEPNIIHINERTIQGIEGSRDKDQRHWDYIFLLLATVAHEYAHWMRTQLYSVDDTPPTLGYAHARGAAAADDGESGFAAEIALFNGFVQCNNSFTADYCDFRIVDRWNVSHYFPIEIIRQYWNRERFEPLILDNPILPIHAFPMNEGLDEGSGTTAKVTKPESTIRQNIPQCPCAPFLVVAGEQLAALVGQRPSLDVDGFEKTCSRLEEESAFLRLKQVKSSKKMLGILLNASQ